MAIDRTEHHPPLNPVLTAIHNRRSIRQGYENGTIDRRDIEQIVAAGLAAPSSKNSQPWLLHVVTDNSVLVEIANAMESSERLDSYVPHDPHTGMPRSVYRSTVHESAAVLRQVPVAIFIENTAPFSEGMATLGEVAAENMKSSLFAFGLEHIGIGAALENMWLAAESLGLRGAFLGDAAIATAPVTRLLGLSGDFVGALALGRSAAAPRRPMDPPPGDDSQRVRWHSPMETSTWESTR